MEYWRPEEFSGLVNTKDPAVFCRKMCHNVEELIIIRLLYNMSAMGGRRRNYNNSIEKNLMAV